MPRISVPQDRPVPTSLFQLNRYCFWFAFTGLGLFALLLLLGLPHDLSAIQPPTTNSTQYADYLLFNARITTMNPHQPKAEAIAIRGRQIIALGKTRDLRRYRGPYTTSINLREQRVLPGLIEAHGHLASLGRSLRSVSLNDFQSAESITSYIQGRVRTLRPRQWLQGRGWDQNKWSKKRFPTHHSLSRAAPDNPVFLTRVDGHAAWVNQRAMTLAGITAETKDPVGGKILRDKHGQPTGVLIDDAMDLVTRLIPQRSNAQIQRDLLRGMHAALRMGITSFHDAGVGSQTLAQYLALLKKRGTLPLRAYVMLSGSDPQLLQRYFQQGPLRGAGQQTLTIRAIKLMADGALGSRGAALLVPYHDKPGHRGLLRLSQKQIQKIAEPALRYGFQVNTHAIGDRANRVVLDAYAAAFRQVPQTQSPRFRIEHAQIVHPQDIPRFAKLGVIASIQSIHCTSDMPWVPKRLGPQRTVQSAYVWQSLRKAGARLANGSDTPVEPINPFHGLYAAITRQDAKGHPSKGWAPEQRLSLQEALHSYTLGAAYAGFQEQKIGSLAPGKLADLIVLDRDIMKLSASQLRRTRVRLTMVNGRILYRAPSARTRPTSRPSPAPSTRSTTNKPSSTLRFLQR